MLQSNRWLFPASVLLGLVIVLGCTLQPLLTVAAIFAIGIVLVSSVFPLAGLCVLLSLFIIQASPLFQTYGVLAQAFTVSDGLALLVIVGYALRSFGASGFHPSTQFPVRARRVMIAMCGLFGIIILSGLWSPSPIGGVLQVDREAVEAVVLFGLSLLLLRTHSAVKWSAATYVATMFGISAWVVESYARNHGFASGPLTLAQEAAYRGGFSASGLSNQFSVLLALAPAFAYIATVGVPRGRRVAVIAASVVSSGFAMLILASRGAIIGAAAALLASLLLSHGLKNRLAVGGFTALVVLALAATLSSGHTPYYLQGRFSAAATDQIGGRGPVWGYTLGLFASHPLLGVGAGGADLLLQSSHVLLYANANSNQNVFLGTLSDQGLVGFVLLLILLVTLGRAVVLHSGRDPACVFILVQMGAAMATTEMLLSHYTWGVLGITYCYAVSVQDAREPGKPLLAEAAPRYLRTNIVKPLAVRSQAR